MRQIKFRAFLDNEMCEVIGIFTNTKEAVCVVTNRILLDDEREQYHIEQTPIEIPFDNIKLMQFSGVKDRNGKEIYEGDIVKFAYNGLFLKGEVVFDNGGWELKSVDYGEHFRLIEIVHLCEVIGNIYENSELLGGQK